MNKNDVVELSLDSNNITKENIWTKGFDIHTGIGIVTGSRIGMRLTPINRLSLKLDYGSNIIEAFIGGGVDFKYIYIIGIDYFSSKHINLGLNIIYNKYTNLSKEDIDLGLPTISWFSNNEDFFFMFSGGIAYNVWNNSRQPYGSFYFSGIILEINIGYKVNI